MKCNPFVSLILHGPRWSSGVLASSWRALGSKPDAIENPPCIGPLLSKSYISGQTSFRWCGAEIWRGGVPAQVSSSSSDRCYEITRSVPK
ncbi:hypothetical protein AVEN_136172-1 [Araneus ventricosus]|uniref:Uncharacterized protein n=1 Tax=Araneus ventricosus TaxID=182803 RepID=A0A4Y2V0Q9_ARAVE|nr:hypothetical protein AVEN_136172-1 [Araneus ventricosus]